MAGLINDTRDQVYDADVYAFDRRAQHYWASSYRGTVVETGPLDRDLTVDVAIIGAGYAGLSAALRCVKTHGLSVAVFDAGASIGWGASGMNGGFVSTGGVKLSVHQMLKRYGEAETRRYWQTQTRAVTDLCAFVDQANIDCEPVGDGNFCVAHSPRVAEGLAAEAETLRGLGVDALFMAAETFRNEVHPGPETSGALQQRPGFGVQPFALVQGLAQAALNAGADIWTKTRIASWQPVTGGHQLVTSNGAIIFARRMIMATNGYTPATLVPRIGYRVVPAISHIIVTQAYTATDLNARGFRSVTPIYNARDLLFYYRRLPDGRLLFGSRGDTTGSAKSAEQHQSIALADLKRVLPTFEDAQIESAWRGLVALTARRTLAVGLHPADTTITFAFGCHGSGTATMQWAGKIAADLIAGRASHADVPAMFRGLPPLLPPSPRALRLGLRAAYRYYGYRDRSGFGI